MGLTLMDIMKNTPEKKEVNKSNRMHIEYIHYSMLEDSEENFYSVSKEEVQELAYSIVACGAVKQNLLVVKIAPGRYKIIAGHKRKQAVKYLDEKGMPEYAKLPCEVETVSENTKKLLLILTNKTQRKRSDYEKMMEVQTLREVLNRMEETGELEEVIPKGKLTARKMREILADMMDISKTKVAQYDNINHNLSEAGKEKFKKNEINVSTANELAGLPPEEQTELLEKEEVNLKKVRERKQEHEESKNLTLSKKDYQTISERLLKHVKEPLIDIIYYAAEPEKEIKELFVSKKVYETKEFHAEIQENSIMVRVGNQSMNMSWKEFSALVFKLFKERYISSDLSYNQLSKTEEKMFIEHILKKMEFSKPPIVDKFLRDVSFCEDIEEYEEVAKEMLEDIISDPIAPADKIRFIAPFGKEHIHILFYPKGTYASYKKITWTKAAEIIKRAQNLKWYGHSFDDIEKKDTKLEPDFLVTGSKELFLKLQKGKTEVFLIQKEGENPEKVRCTLERIE